ncbi:2-amino-4-hydroxy-6-hydroxymethyldihydropteridine diphosphokinase [Marininema halotolerans]|uniref:2-amino-4-hydroxy-6-hydroxymethyldihydropteridine diphosphokinase n=1 Tax=Marininema halotolerans TaxID=1155944 RepID=A0A1I6TAC1_9BACL|nr:2-amino-4-hydroxy-6-hydroxymethyldihydropteridine diphosphokinase [Marininema halotolerans]SFS86164.1 2-amino-4-hydroxy-6-hydroxymethyldihydropteridinediphosphokinase [Marininema halotolerans]
MTHTVYIGLGTNLGDRIANLVEALERLDQHAGIQVTAISQVYETEPWGLRDQPDFLNLCAALETTRSPQALLDDLLAIERDLHRVREVRWGPRTMDLDLLLYGDEKIEEEGLLVPHPRMTHRSFVLVPLADLVPKRIIPGTRKSVTEWMEETISGEDIRCLGTLPWQPQPQASLDTISEHHRM